MATKAATGDRDASGVNRIGVACRIEIAVVSNSAGWRYDVSVTRSIQANDGGCRQAERPKAVSILTTGDIRGHSTRNHRFAADSKNVHEVCGLNLCHQHFNVFVV